MGSRKAGVRGEGPGRAAAAGAAGGVRTLLPAVTCLRHPRLLGLRPGSDPAPSPMASARPGGARLCRRSSGVACRRPHVGNSSGEAGGCGEGKGSVLGHTRRAGTPGQQAGVWVPEPTTALACGARLPLGKSSAGVLTPGPATGARGPQLTCVKKETAKKPQSAFLAWKDLPSRRPRAGPGRQGACTSREQRFCRTWGQSWNPRLPQAWGGQGWRPGHLPTLDAEVGPPCPWRGVALYPQEDLRGPCQPQGPIDPPRWRLTPWPGGGHQSDHCGLMAVQNQAGAPSI